MYLPLRKFVVLACVSTVFFGACSGRRDEPRSASENASPGSMPTDSATSVRADSALAVPIEIPEFLSESRLALVPEPAHSPAQLAALAPAALRLGDLGFRIPPQVPDTTGRKNKIKLQREWVEALQDYESSEFAKAREHLQRARELLENADDPDPNWPARFRNLDAACIYAIGSPGDARRRYGEIALPDGGSILDAGYQWVLGNDALRLGQGREAVARIRIVQQSPRKNAALEARRLLYELIPDSSSAPDAESNP